MDARPGSTGRRHNLTELADRSRSSHPPTQDPQHPSTNPPHPSTNPQPVPASFYWYWMYTGAGLNFSTSAGLSIGLSFL